MEGWTYIITEIDAGGGHKIDLAFNYEKRQVREEKTDPNGALTERYISLPDFNPDCYGNAGWDFCEAVINTFSLTNDEEESLCGF